MRFTELLAETPGVIAPPVSDVEVAAPVVEDSRQVEPGGVFLARRGGSADGHRFIAAALAAGAAAVVGELPPGDVGAPVPYAQVRDGAAALPWLSAAYHGFPARRLVMVGVTGTDGKTTTTHLIYHILRAAGLKAGMVSTLKAITGGGELATGLHVTTPPAPEVQAYLAQMVQSGLTHCVLETTSHGLAQGRVDACEFDVAVLTNVTHEHLDFHGSWEAYRDAKARLFKMLGAAARKPGVSKWAVLNFDDPVCEHFMGVSKHDHVFTYSASGDRAADIWAAGRRAGPGVTRFTGLSAAGSVQFETRLAGAFNAANILAAAGAAAALEIGPDAIARGVAGTPPVPGRMERIDEGQAFVALVDFAHTPNALWRALEAVRPMTGAGGRVIAVFGSAGLRDRAKRRLMAEVGAALADRIVLTAEDPRTESLDAILAEMAAGCIAGGGVEGANFWRVPDRGAALAFACEMARAGDVVVSCGKGHEQSMCFGTVEYPWDDRDALRAALRGAPLKTLPTAQ
ncbi:MAG: UDP-N-acetylmuramoyl-L-alanyl-D-glutamate--2,6-diaminopimelate ligase [Anaerolineae bacterium]|nr:UDP-N-acetylmuramoyl-L-alanyl-D-glutamate--2,6-diaminopimelate ligase [Anaerolineae bacterium]